MTDISRRAFVAGTGAALAATPLAGASAQAAKPKALVDLAAIAAKKPAVVWSESSEAPAIAKVIAAFNKTWPDIKVDYIRDTGGSTLAAKVVQESQAGGSPAGMLTGDQSQFALLDQRGLLVRPDWAALGVAAANIISPFMIPTASAIAVLVWNKQKVSDADAPKQLNDLLNPRWQGKAGGWLRTPSYASMAKLMGEAAVRAHLEKFVTMQPKLYDTTYRLAQEIGTGEIEVGYGLYHSTLPIIASGAPIAYALTDPLAISTLYSCCVNKSANPEGAQVLAAWLGSKEGADAYEASIGRGNPRVEGSNASKLVTGRRISEYPLDEFPTYVKILTEFNKIMSSRGGPR
ncbi:extracellular solute-binding protein [Roseiarcaceae bacterium H3SJ34-1]|uniref:ABC transporter substrate-binding protein n=1 Tax=Terripilifer ovatus TaxID=3032367 RepID=UPI003AB994EC|nr:extracellular solute-binding protein [Roseiarcaceae bacterium H3SJ34-1]